MRSLMYISAMIVVIGLNCCKKEKPLRIRYPEDTQDYDATPVERIANKWWVLDSVSVNGVDYTDTVKRQIGSFKIYLDAVENSSNGQKFRNGEMKFDSIVEKYKNLILLWWIDDKIRIGQYYSIVIKDTIYSYVPLLYHTSSAPSWSILKINNYQLKLRVQDNGLVITNYFTKE